MGITLLGWDLQFFMDATPNLWLKNYILWLKNNNPDAFNTEQEETYTMDQVPLYQ